MRRVIASISLLLLTALTLPGNLPLQAGGCSSHNKKKADIECKVNDEDCIKKKSKISLNSSGK
tara:strand:- start:2113 stop:2301 length:189 start_codon:yes stop_codon:yes gene_type:complete